MFGDFYADYKKACKYYNHPCSVKVFICLCIASMVGACVLVFFDLMYFWLAFLGLAFTFLILACVAEWRVYSKIDYTKAELKKQKKIRKLLKKYSTAYGLSFDDTIDTLIGAAKNRLTTRSKEDTFKTAALILFPAALSSITSLIPEEYKSSDYYKVLIVVLLAAVIIFVLFLFIESQVYDMTVNRKNRSYVSFIDDLSIIRRNHKKMELSDLKESKKKKKHRQIANAENGKQASNELNNDEKSDSVSESKK